jgi:hypothetical protein
MLPQPREIREDHVFKELLKICPGLQDRLTNGSEEEIELVADLVYLIVPHLIALTSPVS